LIIDYELFKDGAWTRVGQEVDIANDFKIDPDNLNGELCALPAKMISYGQLHSQLKSEVSRKEEYVKFIYAQLALNIRGETEKVTEGKIKEQVTINQQYQQALAELNHSSKNSLLAESWWRSINKKADLIQSLVYRESSEIKRGAY